DSCMHGDDIADRWPYQWTGNEDYYTTAQLAAWGVTCAMPHANTTKVLAGRHYPAGNHTVYIGRSYAKPAFPFWIRYSYIEYLSPEWNFFSGTDNNHKHTLYHAGSHWVGNYWYVEKENGAFGDTTGD